MSDVRQVDTITKLRTETKQTDGFGAVLYVAGEVDIANASEFEEALARLATEKIPVAVDLSDVTFMDSTGLHVILATALARNGNGPLKIVNPSRTILRTMQIVGMTAAPEIEVNVEAMQNG